MSSSDKKITIDLPKPQYDSKTSVENSLKMRRSIRSFKQDSISLKDLSQLLWAAQGITDPYGYRTAPSAGALYPIDLLLATGNIEEVP